MSFLSILARESKAWIHRNTFIMPFYGVQVGRIPGVYNTWEECKRQVCGFSDPKFRKFQTHKEASDFVKIKTLRKQKIGTKIVSPAQKISQPKGQKKTLYTEARHLMPGTSSETLTAPSSEVEVPVVYSDGCCFKNGKKGARAGIGVYWGPWDPRNTAEKLEGLQTNQRAELVAAIRALEGAVNENLRAVEIRTDSMYTINAATSWIKKWKKNGWKATTGGEVKNQKEIKRLDELCNQLNVKWVHVAGHSGIFGNDQADLLSKKGAMKD